MIVPGLILLVCGIGLRVWGHGGVEHAAGIVSIVAGLVAIAAGTALRIRRRLRRLRYVERADDRAGVAVNYRTNRGKIAAILIVIVYLLSPVDIAVLDLLLPIGVAGDVSAMAWLAVATGTEVSRHRKARAARRALGLTSRPSRRAQRSTRYPARGPARSPGDPRSVPSPRSVPRSVPGPRPAPGSHAAPGPDRPA